jgi:hypothetical protein
VLSLVRSIYVRKKYLFGFKYYWKNLFQSDKWRYCVRMGYKKAIFANYVISRKTTQYLSENLFALLLYTQRKQIYRPEPLFTTATSANVTTHFSVCCFLSISRLSHEFYIEPPAQKYFKIRLLHSFAKLRKTTISFVTSLPSSVRPSVWPHGITRLPLDKYWGTLIFEDFSKVCRETSRCIKIWHK